MRGQRRQHLQQLPRHVAHAKHRHAPRHRAGQRLARLQVRQRPRMQRRAGGLALAVIQSVEHAAPEFGLPELVFAQRIMPSGFAQQVAPGGPVLQPVGAVDLVLVKQVGQAAGQLQQAVRLVASQETRHGLEHRVLQTARQQSHQPPGHGQFVEWRIGRHIGHAQHLPVSAPQKARGQLHPRGRAHPALAGQLDLDPLGHAVALHQDDFALERQQRVRAQPARQGVGQYLGAVAVQGDEAGRNGGCRHAVRDAQAQEKYENKREEYPQSCPSPGSRQEPGIALFLSTRRGTRQDAAWRTCSRTYPHLWARGLGVIRGGGDDRPDALSTRGLREYAEKKNRHPEHTLVIDQKGIPMTVSWIKRTACLTGALLAVGLPMGTWAQAWPTKQPIKLVAVFPPGGSVDQVAPHFVGPPVSATRPKRGG